MKKTFYLFFLGSIVLLLMACTGNPTMETSMYSSDEASRLRQAAYASLNSRDFAPARLSFERLLIDNPKDLEAVYGLGSVELFSGNFESAVHRYEIAVPSIDSVQAYNRWGVALTMIGRPESALAVFNHALTISPDHTGVLVNRAMTKAIYGQTEEAVDEINHAADGVKQSQYVNQLLLIYVLAKREGEITQVHQHLPPTEYEALLRRALAVRKIATPENQARYIGLVFM